MSTKAGANSAISVVDGTSIVSEGSAKILFPPGNAVFYNPVQQFNRDLSTLGIRAWSRLYLKEKERKRKRGDAAAGSVGAKTKVRVGNGSGSGDSIGNESVSTGSGADTEADIETKNNTIEGDIKAKDNTKVKNDTSDVKGDTIEAQTEAKNGALTKPETTETPFIDIIEALSASGLRAIRYATEIPLVRHVYANDFSPSAVESIQRNAAYCNVESIVVPHHGDANLFMYTSQPVHVVDLDPYGSAAPFADAALKSLVDGGLLLVTCTDASVLAGNGYPEKCFSLYGGHTLYADARHESALRLVLHMLATTAAKYGLAIDPQLSLSIDFYVRLFVRVRKSPATVKFNASKTMCVHHCQACDSATPQPLGRVGDRAGHPKFGYPKVTQSSNCPSCNNNLVLAGPMWAGPLHNHDFVNTVLQIEQEVADSNVYGTLPRVRGMLSAALNELPDVPFYIHPQTLASKLKIASPPHRAFISAICNAGFRASYTHAMAGAIKTDAPRELLWDILKAWAAKEGMVPNNKVGSPGYEIMKKPVE